MLDWLRERMGHEEPRQAPLRRGFALGWVLSDDGRQILLDDAHVELLREAGAELVRVDFRLGRYPRWDDSILAQYERVLSSLSRAGIDVLGLATHEAVAHPQQAQWTANNREIDGGDGHNPFLDAYVAALHTLVTRFHDQVRLWEIWNEPDVWTQQQQHGAAMAYSGGSYIYPSNYAALLSRAHATVKGQDRADVTLISGGVFGSDVGGTLAPEKSGARYLRALYDAGSHGPAHWDTVPFDAVGQHIYLDQGGICPPDHIRSYLRWMHDAVRDREHGNAKQTYVTEAAWNTAKVSPEAQARNLTTLLDVCAEAPFVAVALWYQLLDNPAANSLTGVADPRRQRKPSFAAFQQCARQG